MPDEPTAVVPHGGVCEGGRSAAPWRTYTGTQPETADTDKGTLKVLIDSSPTRPVNILRQFGVVDVPGLVEIMLGH